MSESSASLPTGPTRRAWWRSPRIRLLVIALVLAGTLIYLGYTGFRAGADYYWKVAEVQAKGATLIGQQFKVCGKVVPGSVQRAPLEMKFVLGESNECLRPGGAPTDSQAVLPVVYQGIVPDLFQEDIDVVVEGEMAPDSTFLAKSLLVKCPTKWEAAPKETR